MIIILLLLNVKILPIPKQHYMINNTDIDFSECERDLGVLVN